MLHVCFCISLHVFENTFSDISENTKGAFLRRLLYLSAERTLPSSNLTPLNEMKTSRLEKAVSPHKIHRLKDEAFIDIFMRDLTAINEFIFYVEAEPCVTPEKAEKHKRVAFKKVKT